MANERGDVKTPSLPTVLCGVFALKLVLFPCYHSTDFEVHRNWLALTSQLPLSQWYFENTSIWTLDYPPFFAWFEKTIAQFAPLIDEGMLTIQAEPYFNKRTLNFHRMTVVIADLLFVLATFRLLRAIDSQEPKLPENRSRLRRFVLGTLLLANVGLILVDNIHFQYNAFLTEFLLLSIADIIAGRLLWGGFWYCVLVNFKHIYLYLAPAYAAYYLRHYIFQTSKSSKTSDNWMRSFSILRCIKLAVVIVAPFVVSFGPFIYLGQLGQVLQRLFPIKRGLTHAYWAPNLWTLYNSADLLTYQVLKRVGRLPADAIPPTYTSGLVQEYAHSILPSITPLITLILTAGSMLPFCLITLRGRVNFLNILTLCAFNSYLFGWHVHEKAILLITIPLAISAAQERRFAGCFVILATVAHCSLFPLFFTSFEAPIKFLATIIYSAFAIYGFRLRYGLKSLQISKIESAYMLGFVPLEVCKALIDEFPIGQRFPFLSLMITSVYCAVGIFYVWLKFCWIAFLKEELIPIYKWLWTREQKRLKAKLVVDNCEPWQKEFLKKGEGLRYVGGLDISTSLYDNGCACACFVILSYPELEIVHQETTSVIIDRPYVAGFLAFREVDSLVPLIAKVRRTHPDIFPQVILVDGNGILHPQRFGLASHLGVLVDVPTIGVAKNLHLMDDLIKYDERSAKANRRSLVTDDGTILGEAVCATSDAKNPVFVSIGHRISLDTAVAVVSRCSKYRVPEPTRLADQISRQFVRQWWDN